MTGSKNGKGTSAKDRGKRRAQIGRDVTAEDVRRLVAKLKGEDAKK